MSATHVTPKPYGVRFGPQPDDDVVWFESMGMAKAAIVREIGHWAKWARKYEPRLVADLNELEGLVRSATGARKFQWSIDGNTFRAELVAP